MFIVKIPHGNFEKFEGFDRTLDFKMKFCWRGNGHCRSSSRKPCTKDYTVVKK